MKLSQYLILILSLLCIFSFRLNNYIFLEMDQKIVKIFDITLSCHDKKYISKLYKIVIGIWKFYKRTGRLK